MKAKNHNCCAQTQRLRLAFTQYQHAHPQHATHYIKIIILSPFHHLSQPHNSKIKTSKTTSPQTIMKTSARTALTFQRHPNRRTMTSNKKAPKLQPQLDYRRAQPTLKRSIAHINHTSNKRITDANHITLQHTTIHSLTVSPQKGNKNMNTKTKKKNLRNSSKHQNAPCTEIKSQNKTAKVQQQEKKELT